MVPQGRVENGVVVLFDCVRFPEGQLVTVQSSPANSEAMPDSLGSLRQNTDPATISKERQEALRQLIGISGRTRHRTTNNWSRFVKLRE
jgi:hypothetical protein